MPSDEQQLAEPLLDDGGNDRFVLFPLKYDAVWEMVRLSYDIISSIFKNLSVFWNLCVCWRSLLSLSLSLSSYYQLQYKKAQASFWTAGTFYFFFSFVLISVLLDFFFFFALALDISKINLLLLSLKLSLSLSDFNRGSRFTRRHEALGKAHRGREALHLARVGVLCRFGRDRLGKLGRSFHEGDPNPGGTFFVLFSPPLSEREMCASPREFVFVFSARSSSRERDTHRKPLFSQARAFYGFQIAIENIHSGTFIRWSFLNAARSSSLMIFFFRSSSLFLSTPKLEEDDDVKGKNKTNTTPKIKIFFHELQQKCTLSSSINTSKIRWRRRDCSTRSIRSRACKRKPNGRWNGCVISLRVLYVVYFCANNVRTLV